MTSAYERGTQAPMDITELGPRKPSVFDVPDLSMASPDASLMDIDPDVPTVPPPAMAPRPMPRIHLSGALLPPSLYNKPMLRYKPTQPLRMTMMIRARRRARQRRLQRWDELQEIKFLLGDDDAWYDTYKPYERELQAQFQRERERAQMVFTPEQLRVAKAARRARLAQYMARRTRQDTPRD